MMNAAKRINFSMAGGSGGTGSSGGSGGTGGTGGSGGGAETPVLPEELAIKLQPADCNVTAGEQAHFSISVAGGTEPYTYKWYVGDGIGGESLLENTGGVSGADTASLTTASIAEADNNTEVWCAVTDADGTELTSEKAKVIVTTEKVPLQIKTQTTDWSAPYGASVYLNVQATGGKAPYTYQWYFIKSADENTPLSDSSMLSGSQTAVLNIKAVWPANSGEEYFCEITDANGDKITSKNIKINVKDTDLAFATQPVAPSVPVGDSFTLEVVMEKGTAPYAYQWRHYDSVTKKTVSLTDDGSYTGAQAAALTHTVAAADEQNDMYWCVVTDADGSIMNSNTVLVQIVENTNSLKFTKQPENTTVQSGKTATFTVEVTGGKEPYEYTWVNLTAGVAAFDTLLFEGWNTPTLKVLIGVDGDEYNCVVIDADGTKITSDTATLTVTEKPNTGLKLGLNIKTQPTDTVGLVGAKTSFSVEAIGGTSPYTYQWYTQSKLLNKKYVDLALNDNANISGAKTATITLTPKAAEPMVLWCVVTDADGNTVNTNKVTFTPKTLSLKTQ